MINENANANANANENANAGAIWGKVIEPDNVLLVEPGDHLLSSMRGRILDGNECAMFKGELSIFERKTEGGYVSDINRAGYSDNENLKKNKGAPIENPSLFDELLEWALVESGEALSRSEGKTESIEVKCKDYYTVSNGVNIPRTQTYSDTVKANNAVDKNNDEEDVLYTNQETQGIDQSVISSGGRDNRDFSENKKTYKYNPSLMDFESRYSLIVHDGKELYKCAVCGKELTTKGGFKEHDRIHTGVKPYECATCYKRFRRSSDYRLHEKTHSGQISYQCSVCNREFSDVSNYKKHVRTHTDFKPYKCRVCAKLFRYSGNRDEHEKTHAARIKLKCDFCEKTFARKPSLKEHVKVEHLGQNFFCKICKKTLKYSCSFKVHNETFHK